MKILYITTSFTIKGDSAVIRNNALVKGLIENGCEVDVYTVKWPVGNTSRFFLKEQNGKIHYSELPAVSFNANLGKKYKQNKSIIFNSIKSIIKNVLFYPDVCYQWKSIIKVDNPSQYDLMISSSFCNSSHFAAKKIKKISPSLNWIQIWGDPWFHDDLITPWYLKPFVFFDEARLLRSSDKIVYISKVTADLMKKENKIIANKIEYIPRSYYLPINHISQKEKKNFNITYTGNITNSTGRNILDFIKAISTYNTNIEDIIYVNIYSHIIDKSMHEQLKSISFVYIYSGVDYDEIPMIYAKADALLFISNKAKTSMIPGKFYDYLGTDLPIICLMADIHDEVSTFIKKFGEKCIVCENNYENLINKFPDIHLALGKTFPIVKDYAPKEIAKKYLRLFNEQLLR